MPTDDFESLSDGDPLSDDADWDAHVASGAGVPTMDQHDGHGGDDSQVVDMSAIGDSYNIHQDPVGSDDHYVEIGVMIDTGVRASGEGTQNAAGPIARGSVSSFGAEGFDGYAAWAYANGTEETFIVGIFRVDNDTPTELVNTGNLHATYDSGDQHLVRLEVVGDALTAYVDGNEELSTTDATYSTGQGHGFRLHRESDFFNSQPFVDNFDSDPLAAGGQTVGLGATAESDQVQPMGVVNPRTVNLGSVSESDTLRPFGAAKIVALDLNVESDETAPVSISQPAGVTLDGTSESDLARPLDDVLNPRTYPLGATAEVDVARPFTVVQPGGATLGATVESDVARPFVVRQDQSVDLGAVGEVDVARLIVVLQPGGATLGAATEQDVTRPLVAVNPRTYPLGGTVEAAAAQPIIVIQPGGANFRAAVEVDVARPLVAVNPRTFLLGAAAEADVARPVTFTLGQALGVTSELDVARMVAVDNPRSVVLGTVVEDNGALAWTVVNPRTFLLDAAVEVDDARRLTALVGFPPTQPSRIAVVGPPRRTAMVAAGGRVAVESPPRRTAVEPE